MKKTLILISAALLIATIFVSAYILNNLFFITEKAAVMTLKPVKPKKSKHKIEYGIEFSRGYDLNILKQKHNSPILIFFTGNFFQGAEKSNYEHIFELANSMNFACVITDLPQIPGLIVREFTEYQNSMYPAQLSIAEELIQWILKNATSYNIDVTQMHLMSYTSGAVLALGLLNESRYNDSFKSLVMVNPLLTLNNNDLEFKRRYLIPAFGDQNTQFEFLAKAKALILSPALNYPNFLAQQTTFAQKYHIKQIIYKKISSAQLLFKLGRNNQSSNDIRDFLFPSEFKNRD